MKKLNLIIGILVAAIVAGFIAFIAVEITKQVVKSVIKEKTERIAREIIEEEAGLLTPEEIDRLVQEEVDQATEQRTKDILSQLLKGNSKSLKNLHQTIWAGHEFEVAYLDTSQYQTTGNKDIQFTNNGWYAPGYSLPRSMLLDVDLNRKVKVKITANFEGEIKSANEDCTGYCITTERYHFSEFGIYTIDESGNKQGMRVLGTRHNIIQGNSKEKYNFTELIFENTGDKIIVTDSTGTKVLYSSDFNYVASEAGWGPNRGGDYGTLNQDQKWMLGINCHVNGDGYCKLEIKEIQITE